MAGEQGRKGPGSLLPDVDRGESKFVHLWGDIRLRKLMIAVVFSLVVAMFNMDWVRGGTDAMVIGDIADRDVRASKTFTIVDTAATEELRTQAQMQARPVFDYSPKQADVVDQNLKTFFEYLGRLEPNEVKADPLDEAVTPGGWAEVLRAHEDEMTGLLGYRPNTDELVPLARNRHDEGVQRGVRQIVQGGLSSYVVFDREYLPLNMVERGISVVILMPGQLKETVLRRRTEILTVPEVRRNVEAEVRSKLMGREAALVHAAAGLAQQTIQSNFSYNAAETQARRQEARDGVAEVERTIKKGTVIARAGDPIDNNRYHALQAMERAQESFKGGLSLVSTTGWLLLVLISVNAFASRFIRKFHANMTDMAVLALVAAFLLAMTRLGVEISFALSAASPTISASSYYYLLPLAAGAMLLRILMNSETALVFSLVVAPLAALLTGGDIYLMFFFLTSSLVAAGGIAHTKERLHILQAGLVTGVVNGAFAMACFFVKLTDVAETMVALSFSHLVFDVLFAFVGGLGSAVLVLGLLPLFETFGYVTDNKLLELANLNHPLLKEMMVQAPGSYHHSVIVGSLSEAACESIGANALLARVGCYFHDIGKMKKPSYFIENLRDQENKHDRLAPSMSALIIASHVKEGIELGKRHRLPDPIIDLIPQHHGTALISYFYNKAKQMEDLALDQVDENDYRYPGPRPQTREAGVVMLADATEASTRSIKQPTSGKIRANIQKIFNRVLEDGQLDECPLTLKDLATIADTFHDVLLGIHHNRIKYPTEQKPRGRRSAVITTTSEMSRRIVNSQETLEMNPTAMESQSKSGRSGVSSTDSRYHPKAVAGDAASLGGESS